ncbi:MAG TPA: DNA repair protein RecO [Chiayiivirga sp.]|nr:DNA repair protein RecO [Chiayiivirga sp.]
MERIQSQPGYVLHARAYRETSLLLEVFSRDHGRIGLVARGARGARAQAQRALLQPLQPLLLSWSGRGSLMNLTAAEAAGAALPMQGEALLSAFYINELLLRLLPRDESHQELFWRYAACLGLVSTPQASLSWELRRFERDVLIAVGYGLGLEQEPSNGEPIDADARYLLDPEHGPRRIRFAGVRDSGEPEGVSGLALQGLRDDVMPPAQDLGELRRCMRGVLRHHLGGRDLHSWQVLGEIKEALRADARGPDPRDQSAS